MEPHEYAMLLPGMAKNPYEGLKEDISRNGLVSPIVTLDGKILDGRHRYKACDELGIEPRFEEFSGGGALEYVISTNIHRRSLSEGQRSMVAAGYWNVKHGSNRHKTFVNQEDALDSPIGESRITRGLAAKITGCKLRNLDRAILILTRGGDALIEEVKSSRLTLSRAEKEINAREQSGLQQELSELSPKKAKRKKKKPKISAAERKSFVEIYKDHAWVEAIEELKQSIAELRKEFKEVKGVGRTMAWVWDTKAVQLFVKELTNATVGSFDEDKLEYAINIANKNYDPYRYQKVTKEEFTRIFSIVNDVTFGT